MAAGVRFRLNSPQVVGETVDDEAIVVNLETGIYYSIKRDGILLWDAIVAGATVEEIAEIAVGTTGATAEQAAGAISSFRDSLAAEGLIVPREEDDDFSPVVDLSTGGPGLLEPIFETFSDMQDLVLLDPVHEVDERGWPHAQPAA